MGGLLHLVQRGGTWAGWGPAQSPPRCTKCNSPPNSRLRVSSWTLNPTIPYHTTHQRLYRPIVPISYYLMPLDSKALSYVRYRHSAALSCTVRFHLHASLPVVGGDGTDGGRGSTAQRPDTATAPVPTCPGHLALSDGPALSTTAQVTLSTTDLFIIRNLRPRVAYSLFGVTLCKPMSTSYMMPVSLIMRVKCRSIRLINAYFAKHGKLRDFGLTRVNV